MTEFLAFFCNFIFWLKQYLIKLPQWADFQQFNGFEILLNEMKRNFVSEILI